MMWCCDMNNQELCDIWCNNCTTAVKFDFNVIVEKLKIIIIIFVHDHCYKEVGKETRFLMLLLLFYN